MSRPAEAAVGGTTRFRTHPSRALGGPFRAPRPVGSFQRLPLRGSVTEVSEGLSEEKLSQCQEAIGYRFRNPELLRAALTHASHSENRLHSNERLEFLGDALLGAIVCEFLFRHYPGLLEGELTRIKSAAVSRRICAQVARRLGLQQYVLLGRGITALGTTPSSILADGFESLIAAVFLDGGFEAARYFVLRHMEENLQRLAEDQRDENFKSMLQQYAQKEQGSAPTYVLLDERGPDHNKSFLVAVQLGNVRYAPMWGRSKKEAEQKAAREALRALGLLEPRTGAPEERGLGGSSSAEETGTAPGPGELSSKPPRTRTSL
jgi:ribonuclease-3